MAENFKNEDIGSEENYLCITLRVKGNKHGGYITFVEGTNSSYPSEDVTQLFIAALKNLKNNGIPINKEKILHDIQVWF